MNETDRELIRDQGTRQRGTDSSVVARTQEIRVAIIYKFPGWRYARGIYDIWRISNAAISGRTMP